MSVGSPVLTGRYELGRVLGQGGMAQVYEGWDRVLDRRVAVKVLHPVYSGDAEFLARFRREARAAAGLAHPGIVAIYDTGEDDGVYFIVMEYVQGRTLADVLRDEGSLAPPRAARIVQAVCEALAVAHASGLVHRDVKPANVMVTGTGQVKVMDFGIVRPLESSTLITTTMGIVGTPRYMSPEQIEGAPLDGRSDLYSLGVCLYECLSGRPPFRGPTPMAVAAQHLTGTPRPLRALRPELAPSYEAVTARALAKDPAARYQSAEEFGRDLAAARAGRPIPAPRPPGEEGADRAARRRAPVIRHVPPTGSFASDDTVRTPPPPAPEPAAAPETAAPPGNRPRRAWVAAGTLAAVLGLAGAGLALLAEPPAPGAQQAGGDEAAPQATGAPAADQGGTPAAVPPGPGARRDRVRDSAPPPQGEAADVLPPGEVAVPSPAPSPDEPPVPSEQPSASPVASPQPSATPSTDPSTPPSPSPSPPPPSPPPAGGGDEDGGGSGGDETDS